MAILSCLQLKDYWCFTLNFFQANFMKKNQLESKAFDNFYIHLLDSFPTSASHK